MNKRIRSVADLEQEELRLKGQLESYKLLIKDDITAIKDGLNPVKKVVNTAKKFFTRDKSGPLVSFGLNAGVDILIKRILLARAGWVTRIVIPYFVKNFTSHIIGEEEKGKIVKGIQKFLSKLGLKSAHKKAEAVV